MRAVRLGGEVVACVEDVEGRERGHFLIEQLLDHARQQGVDVPFSATTAYVNTIAPEDEERFPGNPMSGSGSSEQTMRLSKGAIASRESSRGRTGTRICARL